MSDIARSIREIVTLHLNRGILTPEHAKSMSNELLETLPLPDGFALMGSALFRHATMNTPFDKEMLELAEKVDFSFPNPYFRGWLEVAKKMTAEDSPPTGIPMPDPASADPSAIVEYMKGEPANMFRFQALINLWHLNAADEYEEGVQIMAASPSGFLAAPIMAWGAYILDKPLLAEMLLDEGVPSFLGQNLRAQCAWYKGDFMRAIDLLHTSLEWEPFQPVLIEMLAALKMGMHRAHELEMAHSNLGRKTTDEDLSNPGLLDMETTAVLFSQSLESVISELPESPNNFWERLSPSLGLLLKKNEPKETEEDPEQ